MPWTSCACMWFYRTTCHMHAQDVQGMYQSSAHSIESHGQVLPYQPIADQEKHACSEQNCACHNCIHNHGSYHFFRVIWYICHFFLNYPKGQCTYVHVHVRVTRFVCVPDLRSQRPIIYLPSCQSVCLPACLSVCLPVCLAFCLFIYLSIYVLIFSLFFFSKLQF